MERGPRVASSGHCRSGLMLPARPRGDEGPFPVHQAARQPQPLLPEQASWDRSVEVFKEVALLGAHTFPFSVVLAL